MNRSTFHQVERMVITTKVFTKSFTKAFWMSLLLSTMSPFVMHAQATRRNDYLGLTDRMRCVQPHSYATNDGLIPGARGILAMHPLVSLQASNPGSFEEKNRGVLGELGFSLTSPDPCSDGFSVTGTALTFGDGEYGAVLQGSTRGLPFGRQGDHGNEAIGSAWLYAGTSTTRKPSYDPGLGLFRDGWIGATVQAGMPGKIWIPGVGTGKIMIHSYISGQADAGWDGALRRSRGHDVVPHFNVVLPVTVLRDIPGNLPFVFQHLVGAAYAYDRIEHATAAGTLQRHTLGITTVMFDGHLEMTVHGGLERLGIGRSFREVGIAIQPTRCSACQWTF